MSTNVIRSHRAESALIAYKAFRGETLGPDHSEDIVDLLTDLHHYIIHNKIAVSRLDAAGAMRNMLDTALGHFREET